ncbi:MAG TPA: hypothetical protein VFU00_02915 [Gemmatimonadales bacterium]|nr:hypothetical protein [Gemmatimonadales bacterium]
MSERASAVPATAHLDYTALLARLPTAAGERSIEAFSDGLAVWVLYYGPEGGELGRSEPGGPAS